MESGLEKEGKKRRGEGHVGDEGDVIRVRGAWPMLQAELDGSERVRVQRMAVMDLDEWQPQ